MYIKKLKRQSILLIYLVFALLIVHTIEHLKEFTYIPKIIFASSRTTYIPKTYALPTPTPLKSIRIPILIYHYVEYVKDEKDTIRKSLNIIPSIFVQQIETLINAGYTFVTPKEIIDILDGKLKLPPKPVVLSFDDGYRDFYTDVFPILKRYNIKSVNYVVSGFLDKPNYMLIEQLKEVAQSGLVEIGAHTVNHATLKDMSEESAKYEIKQSKKDLENIINIPVVSFAYPNGSFDDQTIRLVKEAGFRSATTTAHGFEINHENKYSLFRIHPGENVGDFLISFLNVIN